MFPRGLVIFILFILLDVITKSIKDKKKIEEARKKRQESLSKSSSPIEKPVKKASKRQVVYREEKLPEYRVEAKPQEKTYSHQEKATDKVDEGAYVHKPQTTGIPVEERKLEEKKPKNNMKSNILRGIIYSEVLSEPKSLRNTRRSI